jgi:hypothetical protein
VCLFPDGPLVFLSSQKLRLQQQQQVEKVPALFLIKEILAEEICPVLD